MDRAGARLLVVLREAVDVRPRLSRERLVALAVARRLGRLADLGLVDDGRVDRAEAPESARHAVAVAVQHAVVARAVVAAHVAQDDVREEARVGAERAQHVLAEGLVHERSFEGARRPGDAHGDARRVAARAEHLGYGGGREGRGCTGRTAHDEQHEAPSHHRTEALCHQTGLPCRAITPCCFAVGDRHAAALDRHAARCCFAVKPGGLFAT
jgi:hypothetical protein